MSEAVDQRLPNNAGRTDLGELAQAAAAEAIVQVVTTGTGGLFASTPDDVRRTFAGLGTVKQFGEFARQFFSRLADKTLQYYISRASADAAGAGHRFPTLAAKAAFDRAMSLHCREASKIVERFAGEWLSKANWEKGGVTRDAASGFAHVAMGKMVDELKAGGREPLPANDRRPLRQGRGGAGERTDRRPQRGTDCGTVPGGIRR